MVTPANLGAVLRFMYPNSRPPLDHSVALDDAGVPFISKWNTAILGPIPDDAQIAAGKLAFEADQTDGSTKRQQAIAKCRAYDPATATAVEVRATLGAALVLLRSVLQELKP